MEITNEDRQEIESRLNNIDEASINRLKELVSKYGADVSHGCFCKEFNKTQLLNRITDWFNQQLNEQR